MIIRCWGARGSIPVSGVEYLKYGGDTTCIELRTRNNEVVIVDAGSGIRKLGNQLISEGKSEINILFTHAHLDHLLGFPFFKPLYQSSSCISIFGCPCAQSSVKEMISEMMEPPNFPIQLDDIRAQVSFHEYCHESFTIDKLLVKPIKLSHPNQGLGYKFHEDGRCFVFLTDNELGFQHPGGATFDHYVRFCAGADLLIHDAEFSTEEYGHTRTWGHSTFVDAVNLALKAKVKALGLFHHNQDRVDDGVETIVRACKKIIADQGSNLECFAVNLGMERRL